MAPWAPLSDATGNPVTYSVAEVNAARIFRALEYFTVGDRTRNAFGGRKTGLLNVNTMWDLETFQALADPQAANHFTVSEVQTVWNLLRGGRFQDVNGGTVGVNPATPGAVERPLWGAAPISGQGKDPQYPDQGPNGVGVQNTLYGGALTPQTLSAPPSTTPNPYAYFELLTKIQNNVTTRSNTFAVFLTVGFFKVIDDTALPVKLGAEIKNRTGQPTRRKMFAVVDRTALALDAPTSLANLTNRLRQADGTKLRPAVLTSETSIVPATPTGPYMVTIAGGDPTTYADGDPLKTIDVNTVPDWTPKAGLAPGRLVFVDVGERREMAIVQGVLPSPSNYQVALQFVDPNTGTPVMPQAHAAGFAITNVPFGNPGPQGKIDLFTNDYFKYVVPYKMIIE